MTSMGPVRTNFPGGAYFSNTVNPISGLMGVGPSGMQVHGSMFAPVQGAMQGPPTAQNYFAAMATQGAMQGPPTATNYFGAQATFGGMQGPPTGTDYYAGIAAARGEMQGPSREAWEEANFNRYLANNGPMQGPPSAREWSSSRRSFYSREPEPETPVSRGQSRFSIGRYIAGHMALAAVGTVFTGMTSQHDFAGGMAEAGGDQEQQLQAMLQMRQAQIQGISSIPFIGGPISAIRGYTDAQAGNSVGDMQRTLEQIGSQGALNGRTNAVGMSLVAARRGLGAAADPLERDTISADLSHRKQTEEFAAIKEENVNEYRKGVMRDAADRARARPLGWGTGGFADRVEDSWSYVTGAESREQHLQNYMLGTDKTRDEIATIRGNKSAAEQEGDVLYRYEQQRQQYEKRQRSLGLSGELSVAQAGQGGNTIDAARTSLVEELRKALAEAQRRVDLFNDPILGKDVSAADKQRATDDLATLQRKSGLDMASFQYETAQTKADIQARTLGIRGGADVAQLASQGRQYEAQIRAAEVRLESANERLGVMATSDPNYPMAAAERAAALRGTDYARDEVTRNRQATLNRITASDVGLKYQMQAAVQFSNRQYGEARTSREIGGIEESTIGAMAALGQITDPETRQRMASNLESSLKLQQYQAQHHYDRGYAEQRDVYKTIKEGYTNPVGALDTGSVVEALNRLIDIVRLLGRTTDQPILTAN